jgi:hypothetical protein
MNGKGGLIVLEYQKSAEGLTPNPIQRTTTNTRTT